MEDCGTREEVDRTVGAQGWELGLAPSTCMGLKPHSPGSTKPPYAALFCAAVGGDADLSRSIGAAAVFTEVRGKVFLSPG